MKAFLRKYLKKKGNSRQEWISMQYRFIKWSVKEALYMLYSHIELLIVMSLTQQNTGVYISIYTYKKIKSIHCNAPFTVPFVFHFVSKFRDLHIRDGQLCDFPRYPVQQLRGPKFSWVIVLYQLSCHLTNWLSPYMWLKTKYALNKEEQVFKTYP